jgi:hypothetical protein
VNRRLIVIPALAAALFLAACTSSGQQQENRQQEQDTRTLINNQPLPHFNYSQERQALIEAETIAANGTQTTSFFFNQGVRDPIFVCPSIGLGVPDSASLSNPDQVVNSGYPSGGQSLTVSQMDPFGVYAPPSSTGTYVICVNAQGQEYVRRWEGFVDTINAPAVWDLKTHTEKLIGPPTTRIRTKKP